MNRKTGPLWPSLMVVLFLCAGCSRPVTPSQPPAPKVVELNETGWEQLRVQQRGQVLMVNFWATWCGPCKEEFPDIVRLYGTYHSRGLAVAAISMDDPEALPAVKHFLSSQGATFGCYRGHFNDFEALVNSINPKWGGGLPATFLYDRQGRLVKSWQGATTYKEFESAVKPLLP